MTDIFSPRKRSEIMSRIRSKSGLDRKVSNWLKGKHIRHRMYPKVEGRPDVVLFPDGGKPVYVFVDGCFFHCCPLHYRRPKSRMEFWIPHVEGSNTRREERRRSLPYKWLRIWEHDVRSGRFKGIILERLAGET